MLLRWDGTVVAFGDNTHGQCEIPVLEDDKLRYIAISAGVEHTVLLVNDGTVKAIGGNGIHMMCVTIPELEEGLTYTKISAGYNTTMLARSDNKVIVLGGSRVQVKDKK